jgi:hypothetical protein
MQQFFSLLSWRLFTAQHVSGVFPPKLNDCSGSVWFYLRIVVIAVLCSWSDRPARPRTQHGYHHDTKIRPEAATTVIELLMMDGRMPETCWAVNKRQDNKLENCCIWLVIYLNYRLVFGKYSVRIPTSLWTDLTNELLYSFLNLCWRKSGEEAYL